MANEYGEPWQYFPREEMYFPRVNTASGETVFSLDMSDAVAFFRSGGRAVACVNALAGVPDAVLTNPTEAQRFALAVLRGDADALILADYLQEHHIAEQAAVRAGKRFVSRGELLNVLRELVAGFDRLAYQGWRFWKHRGVSDELKASLLTTIENAGG